MGIFDTPAPTAYPTTSSSSTSYPAFYQNAMQQVLNMGLASAAQPFQPYQASANYWNNGRIADMHGTEIQGGHLQQQNLGNWQPGMAQAGSLLSGAQQRLGERYVPQGIGTGQWGQAGADQYMSPYIGSVIDRAKRETNRDFDRQYSAVKDRAVAAGAFGGSRHGIVESELERQRGQRLDDITTTGLNNAYLNAQNIFGQDQSRGLQAQVADEAARRNAAQIGVSQAQLGIAGSNTAQQLGLNTQAAGMRDAQGLLSTGAMLRAQDQAKRDFDYAQHLGQQGYGQNQANFLSGIVNGLPVQRTTTSSGQQFVPGTSTASQIGGLGITALGTLGQLSQSGALSGLGSLWNSASSGISDWWNGLGGMGASTQNLLDLAPSGFDITGGTGMVFRKGGLVKRKGYAGGGLVAYASGGLADDTDTVYAPIDRGDEEFDFNGREVGQVMNRLNSLFKEASKNNDNARTTELARKMHGLYPLLKAKGPGHIIGSELKTAEPTQPRVTREIKTPMDWPSSAMQGPSALPTFIPDARAPESGSSTYPKWLPGGGGFNEMRDGIKEGLGGVGDWLTTPVGRPSPRTLGGQRAERFTQGTEPAMDLSNLPSPEQDNLVPQEGLGAVVTPQPSRAKGRGLQPRGQGINNAPAQNGNSYPLMEEANLEPQTGLASATQGPMPSSGQNKLTVPTSPEKAGSLLDSPWLPVLAAGLRMMEAKPGQSFVQNLGGAGGVAINTMGAQREAERAYQKENRKAALEERKQTGNEAELEAKKPVYASQAEFYRYKALAEKYEKVGVTSEGDVVVRDITQDGQPGSMRILDGVKDTKWITAKMGKDAQMAAVGEAQAGRMQIAEMQDRTRREEIGRKQDADADKNEKGFGAEYRAQQAEILKRRQQAGDMNPNITINNEIEAYRHARSVYGETKAAGEKRNDLAKKLETQVQVARDQARKMLKGAALTKQLEAIEQYNRMNRLSLGLD